MKHFGLKLAAALMVVTTSPAWAADESQRVSQLMDASVLDGSGQSIGQVYDVVVEPNGAGPYVIVNRSVDPEERNTLVPVPYAAFERSDGQVALPITREQFFEAPSFPEDDWPNMSDSQWQARVDGFYGVGLTPREVAERAEERQGPFPAFSELDVDGNGKLTPEEVASVEALSEQFEAADVNQDGTLDQAEFSAFETAEGVMPGQIGIEGERTE